MATYTEDGRKEVPDQTPVELPIGYKAPETLEQLMVRMIRNAEFNRIREAAGAETFEEADDFDVEEENDGLSQYQLNQMQEETPIERTRQRTESAQVESNSESNATGRGKSMDDEAGEGEPTPEPVAKRHTKAKKTVAKSNIDKESVED